MIVILRKDEQQTGQAPEVHGPASLVYTAANTKVPCLKKAIRQGQHWKLSPDHIHTMDVHTHTHIDKCTEEKEERKGGGRGVHTLCVMIIASICLSLLLLYPCLNESRKDILF